MNLGKGVSSINTPGNFERNRGKAMKKFKKFLPLLAIFSLLMMVLSSPFQLVEASTDKTKTAEKSDDYNSESMIVTAKNADKTVTLFEKNSENKSNDSKHKASIQNQTKVVVLEEGKPFTYIRYTDSETDEVLKGYIRKGNLVKPDQVENTQKDQEGGQSDSGDQGDLGKESDFDDQTNKESEEKKKKESETDHSEKKKSISGKSTGKKKHPNDSIDSSGKSGKRDTEDSTADSESGSFGSKIGRAHV